MDISIYSDINFRLSGLLAEIDCMKAVAQSFADEYIDEDEKKIIGNIQCRPSHYAGLFNTLVYQLFDIGQELEALEDLSGSAMKKEARRKAQDSAADPEGTAAIEALCDAYQIGKGGPAAEEVREKYIREITG